ASQHRVGDTFAVRGAGTSTEVALDDDVGMYGAILQPLDSTLSSFLTNPFFTTNARPSLGRSLQFGPTNSIWLKPRSVQYGGAGLRTNRVYEVRVQGSRPEASRNILSTTV